MVNGLRDKVATENSRPGCEGGRATRQQAGSPFAVTGGDACLPAFRDFLHSL